MLPLDYKRGVGTRSECNCTFAIGAAGPETCTQLATDGVPALFTRNSM